MYLIRTRYNALYTGIATDVERRLSEHREVGKRGAKSLRGRAPLELVYQTRIGARALALRVESRIKRLPKHKKEAIVLGCFATDQLLEFVGAES